MARNDGGPNPWGPPGGRPPPRSEQRGGGGRPGGGFPDLDDLIGNLQERARRFAPGGGGRGGMLLAGLIAVVAVALWLASGFYRVQPDEQGVVMRFGAFNRTTLPGLNYHIPWPVERALTPSVTRINRVEVGFRVPSAERASQYGGERATNAPGLREVPEEALMLTGDENIIDINFSVFWRVRDVGAFLFNTRNPEETVKAAAESMMRQVIGRTPIQPALTEARARIEQDVTTGTQAILDLYRAGVEITQVQLQRVDPPSAVIDSFRDVQRANTDAERARNEAESYRNDILPRARGEAARLTAEAEGAKQAMVAEASGQAARFLDVYRAYAQAKEVTLKRMYIETMEAILRQTSATVVDDRLRGLIPFLRLQPGTPSGETDR